MAITLRQLEVFRAICREGRITAAAGSVGLTQAAASQALGELENLLQRKLFDRIGKRVVLNAEGKKLLPLAADILDRVVEFESADSPGAAELRLGASLTVGSYMLPPVIAKFCVQNPQYRMRLHVRNTEQIVKGLLQFEFDAGWVEGHVHEPDLRAELWTRDELVIIAGPDHELRGKEVKLSELKGQTWILRERGSGTRDVFERAIQGRLQLDRVVEMSEIEAVKRTVMSGLGLGCVSRAAIEPELKGGHLSRVIVPRLNLRREITLLLPKRKYLHRDLQAFLRFARDNKPK